MPFRPARAMEIIKLRSQLFHLSEQVTAHLRLAQNTLTRLGRDVDLPPVFGPVIS
jgi:hypothetical protein